MGSLIKNIYSQIHDSRFRRENAIHIIIKACHIQTDYIRKTSAITLYAIQSLDFMNYSAPIGQVGDSQTLKSNELHYTATDAAQIIKFST